MAEIITVLKYMRCFLIYCKCLVTFQHGKNHCFYIEDYIDAFSP